MYLNRNGIHVFGEGEVSVSPDTLKISLGVTTEGLDLQSLQEENATRVNKIIQAIIDLGVRNEDIKTVDYRIDPQYRYEDSQQIFTGYRVTHILEITTKKINDAGKIVDTAVRSGASTVSNVQFSVMDSDRFYQQALSVATKDAIQKAETLTQSFGVSFNRNPYLISEEPLHSGPIPYAFTALKTEAPTAIEPGKLAIQARIKAYFHLV